VFAEQRNRKKQPVPYLLDTCADRTSESAPLELKENPAHCRRAAAAHRGRVHRVKPANPEGFKTLQITDFFLALPVEGKHLSVVAGTPWGAPEPSMEEGGDLFPTC